MPYMQQRGRHRLCYSKDAIYVLQQIWTPPNNSRPCDGLILGAKGNRMFHVVDRADGTTHQRHLDQISLTTPKKESHEESVVLREEISEPKPSEVDAEEVIIAKEVIDAVDENVTARELRRG